jgi:hypothetical protein
VTLHAGSIEVGQTDPQERSPTLPNVGTHRTTHRRSDRKDMGEYELNDRPAEPRLPGFGHLERHLSDGLSREDGAARLCGLEGDIGTGMGQPDDEDRPGLELAGIAVVVGVQLTDGRVEL